MSNKGLLQKPIQGKAMIYCIENHESLDDPLKGLKVWVWTVLPAERQEGYQMRPGCSKGAPEW